MHRRAPLPMIATLLALAGAAHGAPPVPGAMPPPTLARQKALENLVRQDCGSCHGMTLKGGLGPDIRGPRLRAFDAQTLEKTILDGVPGTAMPPWRPELSEQDVHWIVQYLLETK